MGPNHLKGFDLGDSRTRKYIRASPFNFTDFEFFEGEIGFEKRLQARIRRFWPFLTGNYPKIGKNPVNSPIFRQNRAETAVEGVFNVCAFSKLYFWALRGLFSNINNLTVREAFSPEIDT